MLLSGFSGFDAKAVAGMGVGAHPVNFKRPAARSIRQNAIYKSHSGTAKSGPNQLTQEFPPPAPKHSTRRSSAPRPALSHKAKSTPQSPPHRSAPPGPG